MVPSTGIGQAVMLPPSAPLPPEPSSISVATMSSDGEFFVYCFLLSSFFPNLLCSTPSKNRYICIVYYLNFQFLFGRGHLLFTHFGWGTNVGGLVEEILWKSFTLLLLFIKPLLRKICIILLALVSQSSIFQLQITSWPNLIML